MSGSATEAPKRWVGAWEAPRHVPDRSLRGNAVLPQPTCTLQLCQSSGTLRCWQKLPGGGEQALHGSNAQAGGWAVAAFGAINYQDSVTKAPGGPAGPNLSPTGANAGAMLAAFCVLIEHSNHSLREIDRLIVR